MTNFFDFKPESSNDINLTDENGYLINPVTGNNTWFHGSTGHGTIFTDEYLDHHSGHVGTYHTAHPTEVLTHGYTHSNHIKMSNPLVVSDHHDNSYGYRLDNRALDRGQFPDISTLVHHYIRKYGGEVLPKYGDPNAPGAEEKFYREQNERNQSRLEGWKKHCDSITAERESDPWHVKCDDPNCSTCNYLPPKPVLENQMFSKDYIKNFTPSERLHVLRMGAMKDGYDGFIFHYSSNDPTIFVLRPSSQIVSSRVVKQNSDAHRQLLQENKPKQIDTGLAQYIRKNDLYEAEKARGSDKRVS